MDAGVVGFKCFLCPSGVDEFPNVNKSEVELALQALESTNSVLAVSGYYILGYNFSNFIFYKYTLQFLDNGGLNRFPSFPIMTTQAANRDKDIYPLRFTSIVTASSLRQLPLESSDRVPKKAIIPDRI